MANPTEITINKTTLEKGEEIVITLVSPDPNVYHTLDFHEATSFGDAGSNDFPISVPPATTFSELPTRPIPDGTQVTHDTGANLLTVAVYYTFTVKTWATLTGSVGDWTVSDLVGQRTVTAVVYPAGTAPTLSDLGLSEGTPEVVSAAIGGYVQGVSTLNWDLDRLAAPGTVIVSGSLEIDGVIYPSASGKTAILAKSGTFDVTGSITNNLGQTVTRTESITVLAYEPPKITNLIAYRATSTGVEDDNGVRVRMSFAGVVSPLTVGTQKNRTTYTLRTRPRGGSTWTTRASLTNSTNLNPTTTVTPTGYPLGTAYEVRVDISDLFGASAAITYVSKGGVLMDWGEGNLGVGKMRERGTLDVGGEIYGRGVFSTTPIVADTESAVFGGEYVVYHDAANMPAGIPAGIYALAVQRLATTGGADLVIQRIKALDDGRKLYRRTGVALPDAGAASWDGPWEAISDDTGWVDLAGLLLSGYSGVVEARRVGVDVEMNGAVTGSFPAGGTTIDFIAGIPPQFQPSRRSRFSNAWRAGYAGNIVSRTNGTAGVAQNTVNWSGVEFTVKFMAE